MCEWYNLRLIDLFPRDDEPKTHPTPPPGVMGKPPKDVEEDEAFLLEDLRAALKRAGHRPGFGSGSGG